MDFINVDDSSWEILTSCCLQQHAYATACAMDTQFSSSNSIALGTCQAKYQPGTPLSTHPASRRGHTYGGISELSSKEGLSNMKGTWAPQEARLQSQQSHLQNDLALQ